MKNSKEGLEDKGDNICQKCRVKRQKGWKLEKIGKLEKQFKSSNIHIIAVTERENKREEIINEILQEISQKLEYELTDCKGPLTIQCNKMKTDPNEETSLRNFLNTEEKKIISFQKVNNGSQAKDPENRKQNNSAFLNTNAES